MRDRSEPAPPGERGGRAPGEYWDLTRRLFAPEFVGKPVREFVGDLARELFEFTGCLEVEIWMRVREDRVRCAFRGGGDGPVLQPIPEDDARGSALESFCRAAIEGDSPPAAPPPGDAATLLLPFGQPGDATDRGIALLRRPEGQAFAAAEVELLEQVALSLAPVLAGRRTHASLRERMKELGSLYRIALLVEQPHASLDELLQTVVEVLPDAWLHPADAWVRLEFGDRHYAAGAPHAPGPLLEADVVIAGVQRGRLAVGYGSAKPHQDIGPFLHEERHLLATVAREIALIIERREVADQGRRLQEQLLHAERLATIGELSAGIAHELNDPLNNVLGFAQLVEKTPALPAQVRRDVGMIVSSALHARQVIQQLLLFARRMPQRRTHLDLTHIVEDARAFLQALCAKADVELICDLAPGLPPVSADPDQLRQVLVNLVVNATQAMPNGGRVTIVTGEIAEGPGVRLVVQDTGTGIPADMVPNLFLPFFTTRKDGTGLGLAVAHGIVTSHGGTISVESRPGAGSRFEVRLPPAGA